MRLQVDGVIGCKVDNLFNSCMAALIQQEELLFLDLTSEISLQEMTKAMLTVLVRFWEASRKETT